MSDYHFIDLRLFLSLFAFSSPKSFLFAWAFKRDIRLLSASVNSDISPSEKLASTNIHTKIYSCSSTVYGFFTVPFLLGLLFVFLTFFAIALTA